MDTSATIFREFPWIQAANGLEIDLRRPRGGTDSVDVECGIRSLGLCPWDTREGTQVLRGGITLII